MSIFSELKRRNVFRVAAAYVVLSWLLVEVATTLLPTFGAPDWVARALIVIVALGFVPAVVFSWVYELTPDGLRRESAVRAGASITRETGRKLDLITIAAVILGVGFVGLSRFVAPPPGHEPPPAAVNADDPSVAVLPFANMSGNPDNEYFSDGLTETLLHLLAQVPDLKVAARTSSFAFKGEHRDVREIADALNVAHVLEGSVQRSGDRVRITVQLIRAEDGFHVWSESYDRTLSDIFYIQDEIARYVSGALTASLLGTGQAEQVVSVDTESIGAYEAYLRALSLIAIHSYSSLADAERELKRALALDPGFHEAKSRLAAVYMRQGNTGMLSGEDAWRRAGALLDEVIAEHPDDMEAQALALINDIDYEILYGNANAGFDAIPALRDILGEAPGVRPARIQLARTLGFLSRIDEAEQHYRILLDTDGLNPQLHWLRGSSLLDNRRFREARDAFARSAELEPQNPNAWAGIGDAERGLGNAVGFLENYSKAMEIDPQDSELVSMVADYLFRFGLLEQGNTFLRRAAAIAPSHPMTQASRVRAAFFRGDRRRALDDARAMIAEDVENRHGAYVVAVSYFANLSVALGDAESGYLFIENNAPAINRPERTDASLKHLFSQSEVFALWFAALPDDQAAAKTREWQSNFEALGFRAEDAPFEYVDMNLLSGDLDRAVELAQAEIFSRAPAEFPDWQAWLERPHMTPLARDGRMVATLDRYAGETERLREELVLYLGRPSGG